MKNIVELAHEFAKDAHASINQTRKYTHEPYIVHPERVVKILQTITDDVAILSAGYLHDVLEDVYYKNKAEGFALLADTFGSRISNIVVDLTNVFTSTLYPELNRAQRHAKENERLALISNDAKTIKLADIIDNTYGLMKYDNAFGKMYIQEKIIVLRQCLKGGNPSLYSRCENQLLDYYAEYIQA